MPRTKIDKFADKKGRPSWKPASLLDTTDLPGFRKRWVDKDPGNLQKKQREGWEFVGKLSGIKAEHEHPETIQDGKPNTSITEYRELTLMALPEDLAKERDRYFAERTQAQTAGLLDDAKEMQAELEKKYGARQPKGQIIIE